VGAQLGFADNPITNSPFDRPKSHFELDGDGQPTGKKLSDRRESIYVVPVPAARRRGSQIDEAAWAELNSTISRPFQKPVKGRICVKVINHFGDEVQKVFVV
jgi:hypothetical protein